MKLKKAGRLIYTADYWICCRPRILQGRLTDGSVNIMTGRTVGVLRAFAGQEKEWVWVTKKQAAGGE